MLEVFRLRTAVGDGDSLRKFASEQEKPWHKARFGISITVVVFHTNDQRRNTNMEFERPADKSLVQGPIQTQIRNISTHIGRHPRNAGSQIVYMHA